MSRPPRLLLSHSFYHVMTRGNSGKYIELNPMRAGIVDSPEKYQFSSYHYYADEKTDDILTQDIFYEELGKNPEHRRINYRKMMIDEKVMNTYKRKVWGSKEQRYNENRKIQYHLNVIKKNYQS